MKVNELLIYDIGIGVIRQIFKPILVRKYAIVIVRKTLSQSVLTYGNDASTVCKSITARRITVMGRAAGCTV
jgi:hypothetical protein